MLDIKYVRQNVEFVREKMTQRGQDIDFNRFVSLDNERRDILMEVETLRSERNSVSKEIGELKKNKADASSLIAKMGEVSAKIKQLDERLRVTEEELNAFVMTVPNIQHESVVLGRGSEDNPVVRTWGEKPEFAFTPKEHWEIGENLNILDFARGAKITGARFTLYRGLGAALERALFNFMLDLHLEKHGYTEVFPPFAVNSASMRGTGQIPKMVEDMYRCADDDLFLIPTAEVPITNIYRDETLTAAELPKYLCGYSACFRREAGSYGKETKGFLRVHQFNKVEMVKFSQPGASYDELEKLVNDAEDILQALNIPYRVLLLCSGDTSFSSAKTYDLEVWSPAENKWLEVSSCSNFEDFQARRANIRFKPDPKSKPEFVHTLNGSGLATSRLMVSLLENNQTPEGKIIVPKPLQKYTGFSVIE